MIVLKDKVDCCGCTACRAVCPVSCITMETDDEGFHYPVTDADRCINCNACNRVCPVVNSRHVYEPFQNSDFYAAQAKDTALLEKSSSGGMFSIIAEYWLRLGGIVFGGAWDNDGVKHIEIDSIDGLKSLRGSKYAQSDLDDSFFRIRKLLKEGKRVMFSGTPCQVDGLKRFIGKDSLNLLTVEVACHGVPSPLVLKKYIEQLKNSYKSDITLDFRDKTTSGWLQYNVKALNKVGDVLFCENHKDNIYMRGFLHELYSRPSCQACPSKGGSSGADFTLCDFWGVEKVLSDYDYSMGVSLMIANTDLAKQIVEHLTPVAALQQVSAQVALAHNGSLLDSESSHPDRKYFFSKLSSTKDVIHLINKCLKLRLPIKLKLKAIAYVNYIKVWK